MFFNRNNVIHFFLFLGLLFLLLVIPQNKAKAYNAPSYLNSSNSIPVMMYHRIRSPGEAEGSGDVKIDNFANQIDYFIGSGFKTLSLSDLGQRINSCPPTIKPSNNKEIVLTFDDGYIDFYQTVYKKFLVPNNLKATVFVVSDYADNPDSGVYGHINWDQIREMSSSGLVEIESHTKSHTNLRNLAKSGNYAQVEYELSWSKRELESNLGKQVKYLAYPQGGYTDKVVDIASKYYENAFTTKAGLANCSNKTNPLTISRERAPDEPFSNNTGGYMPYVPDPNVQAGKVKLTMAKILNRPNHSTITTSSKVKFFNWLESDEYFWKTEENRYNEIHAIQYDASKIFNDGTPWAYVLGDGEHAVKPNFGAYSNYSNAPRIKYPNSIVALNLDQVKNIARQILGTSSVTGNLITQKGTEMIKTVGRQQINVSKMMEHSTLSYDRQLEIVNTIVSVMGSLNISKNLNDVKVGGSLTSFSDGNGNVRNYIITNDNQLIFNEDIYFSTNSGDLGQIINEGLSEWLNL